MDRVRRTRWKLPWALIQNSLTFRILRKMGSSKPHAALLNAVASGTLWKILELLREGDTCKQGLSNPGIFWRTCNHGADYPSGGCRTLSATSGLGCIHYPLCTYVGDTELLYLSFCLQEVLSDVLVHYTPTPPDHSLFLLIATFSFPL